LNARLKKNGGRVFLVPDVKIHYFARGTYQQLWRMYYQYGLFKPLVNRKIGIPASARQLAPPLFALFIAATALGGIFIPQLWNLFAAGIFLYAVGSFVASASIALSERRPRLVPYLGWAFLIIHFAYGTGYLHGIFKFLLLRRDVRASSIPISR